MKRTKQVLILLLFTTSEWGVSATLLGQGVRDTTFLNSNTGIPNSGNTLYPNNGPEFPHSSAPDPTTDPGPLTPGTNGNMIDTVPHNKIKWYKP